LGVALYLQGDEGGAIAELYRATALNPTYADARVYLGTIFHHRGDIDGAIAEYREALRINPAHAGAHANLGVALKNKGDLDGAIQEYQQALALNPQSAAARHNLDIALRERGERQGPLEVSSAEKPKAEEQGDSEAGEADWSQTKLSEVPIETETLPAAAAEADRSLSPASSGDIPNKEPQARKEAAQAGLSLPPEKEEEYGLSLVSVTTPNQEALFHYQVGQALEAKGDPVRAKREYQEAQKHDPNFAAAFCSLGLVLEKTGDKRGAAIQLTRCLKLASRSPQAASIQERLTGLGYPRGIPPIK
jgi:Flp pilus assembly protein TadD